MYNKFFAPDKIKHIAAGLLIYSFLTFVLNPYISIIVTIIIGGAKEIIWDKYLNKGFPDWWDFIMTIVFPIILFSLEIFVIK